MQFGGLQKTTLVDYPGRVAATVFTLGCNFRCPYCHNLELVLPDLIEKQPKFSEEEILSFLRQRQGLLTGLCITGGEPTIHSDLEDFIKKVKELGYKVKLDSNGSRPEVLRKLIENQLIDYVAMDIKAPLEKYHLFTNGQDFRQQISDSINLLKEGKVDYEFRTTLAPDILTEEDIFKIVELIKGAPKYFLQRFKGIKTLDPSFSRKKPWPEEKIRELVAKIKPLFSECELR